MDGAGFEERREGFGPPLPGRVPGSGGKGAAFPFTFRGTPLADDRGDATARITTIHHIRR